MKTKKLAAALLAAALLGTSLVSCERPVPEDYVKLIDNGVTSYRIVRSDTSGAGEEASVMLRRAMNEISDTDVKIITDFEHEKLDTMRTDFEILVGKTNREESEKEAVKEPLTYLDYEIHFDADSTRPVINGGSSEALCMAAEYLIDNCFYKNARTFALPKGKIREYRHDYPIDSFTIGGEPLENYVLVADSGDDRGKAFADVFRPLYGKTLRVEHPGYKDPSDCEIIFSSANDPRYADIFAAVPDTEYMYRVEGTKIYIGANGSYFSDAEAWQMFCLEQFGSDLRLLSGNIAITDCHGSHTVPTAPRHEADEAFLQSVDEKAQAKRESILTSPNMEIPKGTVCFYMSPNGSDANDGKSPESAWKSLEKLNAAELPASCCVLFERGGVWRGQIEAKAGVTYTAYGEGAKPCLYGSPADGADPDKWSLMPGTEDIWVYEDEMMDSGALFLNGGRIVAYKEIPTYAGGRFVCREDPSIDFDIVSALDNDLDFFCEADSVINNDMPSVSSTDCVGKLYFKCTAGNPGSVFESIEFAPRRNGFAIKGDNVHIDNFTIKYVGAHGIGSGTRAGLTVTNCELGYIGGGIQSYSANGTTDHSATRFGNAVEIYGGCDGFKVNNCYVYEVYDAGLTPQYKGSANSTITMKDIDFSENLIEYCVYSVEYFHDTPDDPAGRFRNFKIHDNIMRFSGFGWGNQRPNYGSQAHIKGWSHRNPAEDFEIYDNIMDRAGVYMIDCGYVSELDEPKFHGNTFIQYEGDLFGKYHTNPQGNPVLYDNSLLVDERLLENDFYFVQKSDDE